MESSGIEIDAHNIETEAAWDHSVNVPCNESHLVIAKSDGFGDF